MMFTLAHWRRDERWRSVRSPLAARRSPLAAPDAAGAAQLLAELGAAGFAMPGLAARERRGAMASRRQQTQARMQLHPQHRRRRRRARQPRNPRQGTRHERSIRPARPPAVRLALRTFHHVRCRC
ncbi:hypothetical protein [Burkholderia plantarii]|uniref:hypothetical protein n=1 Tax=Burkholderia plantarii TaxID=41899 RepID=UPI001C0DE371|nr:hypothetical protein [Burkholderia plantarii]